MGNNDPWWGGYVSVCVCGEGGDSKTKTGPITRSYTFYILILYSLQDIAYIAYFTNYDCSSNTFTNRSHNENLSILNSN